MTSTLFSEAREQHFASFAASVATLALRAKRTSQTATDGMSRTEAMTDFLAAIAALQMISIAMTADDTQLLSSAREILR